MKKIIFSKKIPFYYAILIGILSVLAGSLFSILIYQRIENKDLHTANTQPVAANTQLANCEYIFSRLKGYHFIKPLLFADQNCESGKYKPMKEAIGHLVDKLKYEGTLASASVYVRDFDESAWVCYNPDDKYDPASLLKIPVLIACLRESEDNPGLLDRQIAYPKAFAAIKNIHFPDATIKAGHKYSIRQLLFDMIAYSDNDATQLLLTQIPETRFLQTFTDLGLEAPGKDDKPYFISAKDCSVFLKVLYDGSYLNIRNSDYAISLLAECDFKLGIANGLPPNVKVANKFGESGDGQTFELSETGIVYFDRSPYLVTIMTRGNDIKQLPAAISKLSNMVYNNMANYN